MATTSTTGRMVGTIPTFRGQVSTRNMIKCQCGAPLQEERIVIRWQQNSQEFTIFNVPLLQCMVPDCRESYYKGDVQLKLSLLASEMEAGHLIDEIDFRDIESLSLNSGF